MKRSKSSRRWLDEHHADGYVQKSKEQDLRSRAFFKLEELDKRDRLLKPGLRVIELGAAPGGWTQYAAGRIGSGFLLAVDILPMAAVEGATVLQADFTEAATLEQMRELLGGLPADLVLSDMAPNFTGQAAVDQPRSMYLAELALELCEEFLTPGGDLVVKTFQGAGIEPLLQDMRNRFTNVRSRKPNASRARSREVYIVARGRRD